MLAQVNLSLKGNFHLTNEKIWGYSRRSCLDVGVVKNDSPVYRKIEGRLPLLLRTYAGKPVKMSPKKYWISGSHGAYKLVMFSLKKLLGPQKIRDEPFIGRDLGSGLIPPDTGGRFFRGDMIYASGNASREIWKPARNPPKTHLGS